jgi:hypothetical protein
LLAAKSVLDVDLYQHPPVLVPDHLTSWGFKNTNPVTATVVFGIQFDVGGVTTLTSGEPFANINPGPLNYSDFTGSLLVMLFASSSKLMRPPMTSRYSQRKARRCRVSVLSISSAPTPAHMTS